MKGHWSHCSREFAKSCGFFVRRFLGENGWVSAGPGILPVPLVVTTLWRDEDGRKVRGGEWTKKSLTWLRIEFAMEERMVCAGMPYDRWMNEWMAGWLTEWMNGWLNEWMNEWMLAIRTAPLIGPRTNLCSVGGYTTGAPRSEVSDASQQIFDAGQIISIEAIYCTRNILRKLRFPNGS